MVGSGLCEDKPVLSSCPECQKNSRVGSLREYYVNLEESLVLCDNQLCCYMSSRSEIKEPDRDGAPAGNNADAVQSDVDDILSSLFCDDFDNVHNQSTDSAELSPLLPSDIIDSIPLAESLSISKHEEMDVKMNSRIDSLTSNHQDTLYVSSPTPGNNVPNNPTTIPNEAFGLLPGSLSHVTHSVPQLPSPAAIVEPQNDNHRYIMLWANIDALCWLDVLLCVLCHNQSVRVVSELLPYSSIIKKLLLAYDESQKLIEPLQSGNSSLLRVVMEQDRMEVKLGGGYCMDYSRPMLATIAESKALTSEDITSAKRKVHLAHIKLECAREEIWQMIEPQSCYKRGADGSPVRSFPLIIKPDKSVSDLFITEYTWIFRCSVCQHTQNTRESSHMITFPKISKFEINRDMLREVDCGKCMAPNQKKRLTLDRLSANLVMHFADGMNHSDLSMLNFTSSSGGRYVVSAVVEYKTSPNHFALWQRDISVGGGETAGRWMCYDDLKSKYAQFCLSEFKVPPPNIHIVFWESLAVAEPNDTLKHMQCYTADNLVISSDNSRSSDETNNQCIPLIEPCQETSSKLLHNNKEKKSAAGFVARQELPAQQSSSSHVAITPKTLPTKPDFVKPAVGGLSALSKSLNINKYKQTQNVRDSSSGAAVPSRGPRTAAAAVMAPSRVALSTGLSYGLDVFPVAPSAAVNRNPRSHADILGVLSAMSPMMHYTAPTFGASNDKPKPRPSFVPAKTYLDQVKPLLQKNKQQTGRELTGYVPKSKRASQEPEGSPIKVKRKRVMFSGVSDSTAKSRPKSSRAKVLVTAPTDKAVYYPGREPLTARLSIPKTTKNVRNVQSLVDSFVSLSPAERAPIAPDMDTSQSAESCNDMPTLDEMLNDMF